MFPLLQIFDVTIGLYQIMALCGVLATGFYCCRISKKLGYDDTDTIIFLLLVSIGVLAGGSLLYAITNFRGIIHVIKNFHLIDSWNTAWFVLQMIFGGSVFYGGLLVGLLVAAIYLRKKPEHKYLVDIAVPGIPLFHFFGRIGCFLGGCCYGIPSKIGFIYTNSLVEEANGVRRFPVPLLEALFNLLLFFLLAYFYNKEKFKNKLLFIYLALYATGRFFIEFLRGDIRRGIWLFLSTSQIISILILIVALTQIIKTYRKTTPV